MSTTFSVNLQRAEHTRHYSIQPIPDSAEGAGWEVRLEEDREVRHRARYRDWHRVERAKAAFRLEVLQLTSLGWAIRER